MTSETLSQQPKQANIHWPSLLISLGIMLVGTVYPLVFTRSDGSANHSLAFALFWAMSAGLVRGVGFIPRALIWKLLFSGGSCAAGLALATWTRLHV